MAQAKNKPAASETAISVPQAGGEVAIYDYGQAAGAGWEDTDTDDFSIPWIKQLQSLSPEVEEGGDAQVEGAKAGLFFNTVTKELMPSFNFIVVRREHVYVEWVPDNGGYAGTHQKDSPVVADAKANAVDQNKMKTENGNDLIDTFQLYLGILNEAGDEVTDFAIMAFTSTKQKPYRDMMTRLRTIKGSKNIPLFAHRSTMTAVKAQNKKGERYFNVETAPLLDTTAASLLNPADATHVALLESAQGFAEGVSSGERTVKYEAPVEGSEAGEEATDGVF
tara:strand:- start:46276 stop:47112 length:837 start_codon:yes stop_codon:yes gene_type:complete